VVALALAVTAALVLTGCFKMDMKVTISENDTVSGDLIFAMDRSILAFTNQSEDEFIDEMVTEARADIEGESDGNSSDPVGKFFGGKPSKGHIEVKEYRSDKFIGAEYVFSGLPLDEFNEGSDSSDDFSIVHEDGQYVVDATLDLTEGSLSEQTGVDPSDQLGNDDSQFGGGNLAQLFASAEVGFSFTFPGKVTKANGDIDGDTVSWEAKYGEITKMHAEAKDSGSGGGSGDSDTLLWALIGVGVVVLLAAGLVVVLLLRGRKRRAALAATQGQFPGYAPGGYGEQYPPAPGAAYPPVGGEASGYAPPASAPPMAPPGGPEAPGGAAPGTGATPGV
jgi:hypothetical protein